MSKGVITNDEYDGVELTPSVNIEMSDNKHILSGHQILKQTNSEYGDIAMQQY